MTNLIDERLATLEYVRTCWRAKQTQNPEEKEKLSAIAEQFHKQMPVYSENDHCTETVKTPVLNPKELSSNQR